MICFHEAIFFLGKFWKSWLIHVCWVHSDYPDLVFAELGPNPVLPDGTDTVLEVRLRERA